MREIEIKLRLGPGETDAVRRRLQELRAQPGPIDEETNTLFESADGRLRPAGALLRLRTFTGRLGAMLTFKGPVDPRSSFKSREELEVGVDSGSAARGILDALGYRVTAQYEKRRESWQLAGAAIALDRLSSGEYIEIEGNEASINSVLASLGLTGRPHIKDGYATLEGRAASPR
jgi:predicted adenylyl cyclase CyaB